MMRSAGIGLLSMLLQLHPKRMCLLIFASWSTNCDTCEFCEQLSFIGDDARVHVTPITLWPATVIHFLRKLGVKDPQVERSSIPSKRLGGAGHDDIVVRWLGGEFQLIQTTDAGQQNCIHTMMVLIEAYVIYMNGGDPPDNDCCWDLSPLPVQTPLLRIFRLPVYF